MLQTEKNCEQNQQQVGQNGANANQTAKRSGDFDEKTHNAQKRKKNRARRRANKARKKHRLLNDSHIDRLAGALENIKDPRAPDMCTYPLSELVLIIIVGLLCGYQHSEEFVIFAKGQQNWLRRFVALKNGIPSHDTLDRVLRLIPPEELMKWYIKWAAGLHVKVDGSHVAIDGKKLRGSAQEKDGEKPLFLVNAFCSDAGLALGQLRTEDKGGEFEIIPLLLKKLNLKGALVTIDAAGCYREIIREIRLQQADYVIALKANQPTLYGLAIKTLSLHEELNWNGAFCYEDKSRGHGRTEKRNYYACAVPQDWKRLSEWQDLRSFIVCISERTIKGVTTVERRYYVSSREAKEVQKMGNAIRSHWKIENSLHWVLDVTFGEDACLREKKGGSENLSTLRKMVLSMLLPLRDRKKGLGTVPQIQCRATTDTAFRAKIIRDYLCRETCPS